MTKNIHLNIMVMTHDETNDWKAYEGVENTSSELYQRLKDAREELNKSAKENKRLTNKVVDLESLESILNQGNCNLREQITGLREEITELRKFYDSALENKATRAKQLKETRLELKLLKAEIENGSTLEGEHFALKNKLQDIYKYLQPLREMTDIEAIVVPKSDINYCGPDCPSCNSPIEMKLDKTQYCYTAAKLESIKSREYYRGWAECSKHYE